MTTLFLAPVVFVTIVRIICTVQTKWQEKKSTTAPVSNYEVQKNLFAAGWNSYIDKITGEGKDI